MLPGDLSLFWTLIKRDWTFPALIVSLFGLSLGQWINISNPLILILGLILFSSWDAVCYEIAGRSDKRENMVRYRIGQTSVQILIITLMGLLSDWNTCKETSGISVFHIALYAVILWYVIWWFYPAVRVNSLF